jgi:hypothetical protein
VVDDFQFLQSLFDVVDAHCTASSKADNRSS